MICFKEFNPLFLSMKMKPSFLKYHDIIGINLNSFFKIKMGSSNKKVKKKVSQADW
jgi:hypothetical protein